jgi:hypothetical protein
MHKQMKEENVKCTPLRNARYNTKNTQTHTIINKHR